MEALDVVHDPSSSEPSASLTTEHPGGKKPVRAIAPTQHSNQVILGFASPHHVQRTFDMRRAGPPVGEINSIVVQTLSSPKGQVTLPTDREMRVSELKTMLLHHLHLSPRKALVLRWHGSALDDAATLAESHLHDKCTIELAVRKKAKEDYTPEDYDIRQVRIRSLDGSLALVDGLSSGTLVKAVKRTVAERKLLPGVDPKTDPATIQLIYSSQLTAVPVFGNPLADESTLGSAGMLNDDVLYLQLPRDESAAAAKDGGKKDGGKKGGKKKK